jgi:hypothetical protein
MWYTYSIRYNRGNNMSIDFFIVNINELQEMEYYLSFIYSLG